ncbi:MAG TPA: cytochrome b [Burkholderiaceae bacterium]|jgi:cytochrome b561|nr:cytochrome b [Burkholderiaceae bacterium]
MKPSNPPSRDSARYTTVAVVLHWFLAAVIVVGFLIGLQMSDEPPSPFRVRWINYHKWIGVTILGLSVLRLLWRISHRPPALPESMQAWQRTASNWVHRALYLFFFIVPVAGWAYSSALGFHVVWLGLIRLPDLAPKDKALADVLIQVHATLAWTLATLVGVHVVAALKHHFLDRDGLLLRMSLRLRKLAR